MFSIKKKRLWFVTAVLIVSLLLGIGSIFKSPAPYYLAVVVPLSGQDAAQGNSILNGINDYLEQVNNKGGIAGKPVALKVFDEPTDPAAMARLARAIAHDPTILLVLGHRYSDNALAASRVYHAAQLPAITATASDNAITEDTPWFFMLAPNNRFQGAFTAHYLNQVFASKTVGIIYDADAFGTSLFDSFSQTAHEIGIDIQYSRKLDRRQADRDQALETLAADFNTRAQPDILYLATQAQESARLLSLIQSADNKLTVVCSSVCADPQFLEHMRTYPRERAQPGYYSNNLYVMSPFILDIANQQAQSFYQQLTHATPSVTLPTAAAYYYDATQLAVAALHSLKAATVETMAEVAAARAHIRHALAQRYDRDRALMGVTGPLYFDRDGNAATALAVGVYAQQTLISAPIQYRPGEEKHTIPVHDLLDDLWSGDVFLIDDRLLRRSRVVYTGIEINAIKQVDTHQSRYSLDFYLWFRFNGPFADSDIQFENTVTPLALGEPLLNQTHNDMTTRAYRITGEFKHHFRFEDYPFDRQTLAVRFHHKTERADRLLYVSDTLGLDRTASSVTGREPAQNALFEGVGDWALQKILLFQDRIKHQSSLGVVGRSHRLFYSRFNTLIEIKRAGWSVLLKNLFPILLLALLAYLAYFTPASKGDTRIKLGTSALITTAFFHLKLITTMAVDYVMVIEYFFFAVYLLSVLVIFISMVNASYHSKLDEALANDTESQLAQRYRKRIRRLDLFGKLFHPALIIFLILVLLYRYR